VKRWQAVDGRGRPIVSVGTENEAERMETAALREALGPRVQPVPLPPNIHDVDGLGW